MAVSAERRRPGWSHSTLGTPGRCLPPTRGGKQPDPRERTCQLTSVFSSTCAIGLKGSLLCWVASGQRACCHLPARQTEHESMLPAALLRLCGDVAGAYHQPCPRICQKLRAETQTGKPLCSSVKRFGSFFCKIFSGSMPCDYLFYISRFDAVCVVYCAP